MQHKVHLVGSKKAIRQKWLQANVPAEDDWNDRCVKFWKKCINYSVLVFLHLKTQIKKKVPPEKKFWKLCQKLKLTNAAQNNEMMVVSRMIVTWNQD